MLTGDPKTVTTAIDTRTILVAVVINYKNRMKMFRINTHEKVYINNQ